MTHLAGVDLNLLPLLDAILAERHLTRAARRVGLSQPAASRALGRLRTLLADPLLVRSGPHWILTPRAEALRGPVRRSLALVEETLAPPGAFRPELERRRLRIACDDYSEFVVLTPLFRRLARRSPGIDVEVLPNRGDVLQQLARGEADLALAPLMEHLPTGVMGDVLSEDGFVGMVSTRHPFARKRPTLKQFVAARHALIAPSGERGGFVDRALRELGHERHVSLMLPHFLAMPFQIAHTDLVLTMAERVARVFAGFLPVKLFAPPLALPRFQTTLYWHQRDEHDPGSRWVRHQALALRAELERSGTRARRTRGAP
ncbi:MAG: LysR family transcriptional regulator [Myxococcales bacterium]